MLILYIIVIILIIEFIADLLLDKLNLKHELNPVTGLLNSKFSYIRRKKMHTYHKINFKLGFYQGLVSLLIILTLLIFYGFGYIDIYVQEMFNSQVLSTLAFFAIIGAGGTIIAIPWDIYHVFYVEKRFGFNKQTPKVFLLDKIKGLLLAVIIGGGLLALITWIYYHIPDHFWWLTWSVITLFSLVMTMFYSNLIVPLFNKQTPLEAGELRDKIEQTVKRAGFKLDNIFVIDGSKRSTKSNAYFTGLGPKKRIVLFDTLINDLDNDEIVAVLSHEIGHYKKNHIIINFVTGVLQTGLILLLFDFIAGYELIYKAVGAEQPSFHIALLVFGFLFTPISIILGLITNYFSRKAEYEADSYAAALGEADPLQSALIKLTDKNLSNINPHPTYVFVHYSHPPVNERIKNLANE